MRWAAVPSCLFLVFCLTIACGYVSPGEELGRQYKRGERDSTLRDLRMSDLKGAHLPGIDLSWTALDEPVLRNANLSGASLTGTTLPDGTIQERPPRLGS